MGSAAPIFEVFGLRVQSHFPLNELPLTADGVADLELTLATASDIDAAFSGPRAAPRVHETTLGDGCNYRVERGVAEDFRIDYGDRARFHLSFDGRRALCAPTDAESPAWRRFLLDTVLGTAALQHGYEALHAAAALTEGGLLAIAAGTSSGKSTLLARLVRAGDVLFCDDVLVLMRSEGRVLGAPGPPLMNLDPVLADGTRAADLGDVLAVVDGECWTRVERPGVASTPVEAVVFLERGSTDVPKLEVLPSDPTLLLANSLVSGRDPARLERRFALFAELAQHARLVRLRVPLDTPPDVLADLAHSVLT